MDIVDRIFKLADNRFAEQKDFALALNTSPTMVSAWRTRKSASYNKRLPEIAAILDTKVDYLLTGEEKEPATLSGDELDAEVLSLLKQIPPGKMGEVKRYLRFQGAPEEK